MSSSKGKSARRKTEVMTTADGLSQAEELFCTEFVKTADTLAAFKAAGYTAPTDGKARERARGVMKRPLVAARINKLRGNAALSAKMNLEYFLERIKRNIEDSAELGDFAASNKALELGMRWLGMVGEKVTPAAQNNVSVNLFSTGNEKQDISRLANIAGYKLMEPKSG